MTIKKLRPKRIGALYRRPDGQNFRLELWTSLNESLTSTVAFVFAEVLDESCSEVFSLNFPLRSVCVCVAWVEDVRINTLELCRNYEVEVRDSLGRSAVDAVIEDSVDDTTSITDRDTFSSSVPASVYEVSLSTALLHMAYELLSILCRVEFEECLSEAS